MKIKTTTEEELRAYTIGELKPLTAPIEVSDYDPAWPLAFEREATRIRGLLGDGVALLEHAGSTSVPGLPAKPLIDMILAVRDSSDESTYVPALLLQTCHFAVIVIRFVSQSTTTRAERSATFLYVEPRKTALPTTAVAVRPLKSPDTVLTLYFCMMAEPFYGCFGGTARGTEPGALCLAANLPPALE